MFEIGWTEHEKQIAHQAFHTAYERETFALIKDVNEQASVITELEQVWTLHDFLSAKRHQIDGKYDYRDSVLIFVFAQLVKEGWLHLDELKGLESEKLTKIVALTRI